MNISYCNYLFRWCNRSKARWNHNLRTFYWFLLAELIRFIKENEKVETKDCLIILDNASVYRSLVVKEFMKKWKFKCGIYSQFSLELAPIEHYFSKLKQEVIIGARGKDIDWKSPVSSQLLKRYTQAILPWMIRRVWLSFTGEIYKILDKY